MQEDPPIVLRHLALGISVPPVHRFDASTEPATLGAALRELLTSPPTIVPPDAWSERADLNKQFLKAAGYRSWRQLESGAVSCWIEAQDGGVTFTPLCNGGTRGDAKGFQPFGAPEVLVPLTASDVELGSGLRIALERSR